MKDNDSTRRRARPAGKDEPWEPGDGTCWLYFPQFGEWHGWISGEDGLFVRAVAEFRRTYPEAPAWDDWTGNDRYCG